MNWKDFEKWLDTKYKGKPVSFWVGCILVLAIIINLLIINFVL